MPTSTTTTTNTNRLSNLYNDTPDINISKKVLDLCKEEIKKQTVGKAKTQITHKQKREITINNDVSNDKRENTKEMRTEEKKVKNNTNKEPQVYKS